MQHKIIQLVANECGISERQVGKTVNLLNEGATIPFISRYRKEMTGGLDEVEIQNIKQGQSKYLELSERKETILSTIDEQGKLTQELKQKIESCWNSNELEDIYLPYKPKRKTKAVIAIENGLEPLAKIIMAQNSDHFIQAAEKYTNENVKSADDAIQGALHIIAEWANENQFARNKIRNIFRHDAIFASKLVKGKEEEGEKFKDYFSFEGDLKRCPSHRVLAIRRGESEGFLRAGISISEDKALQELNRVFVKNKSQAAELVEDAVKDAYKRLMKPSIESEFAASSKEKADEDAIKVFAENLRQLLMASPLGSKKILAIDPGFRTGCKVVCLDEKGDLQSNFTIYPHKPQQETKQAAKRIVSAVSAYKIEAIAIGNGTASRETEYFIKKLHFDREVRVYIVNEAGASVYSASSTAREEFPEYDVTVRGAVSIGRRLMDPLAELVKIDPKSIGVGQYQHDVDQKKLQESLDNVVESCVNKVGVDLNTASKHLLAYVSGLGPQLASNIVEYRSENGKFTNRNQLKKVKRLGDKAFEQCAGFLRIREGENILDYTAVHPESYAIVKKMAKDQKCTVDELINSDEIRKAIDLNNYISDEIGLPTLEDIIAELEKPGRDPRSIIKVFEFAKGIHKMEDLEIGMVLPGIVSNITNFGAFVDIGIKQDGLIHISHIANEFVSNPADYVSLHQHVKVKVIDVDISRKRIQLSLKDVEE